MLDFSEKVKKFEPHEITDPSQWKYCYEYLVMGLLIHFFPEKYLNLVHSDSPDLFDKDELGIEVTTCFEETYNKSIGEWTNYRLGKKGKNIERCKKVIAEQGGHLYDLGIITHPVSDEKTQIAPIVKGIDSKLAKLKTYRHKFKECTLAIVLQEPIPTVPSKAISYFESKQSTNDFVFDNLIIVANREFYIYEYQTKTITKDFISREDSNCLNNIGVMIVNNYLHSIKECFVSPFKQREIDCINEVKNALFNKGSVNIERSNADFQKLKQIFSDIKPYDDANSFPDFVFDGGILEHFIVTSIKDSRKGSYYKIYENNYNKETDTIFTEEDSEFLLSEPKKNRIRTVCSQKCYNNSTYINFLSNFKKHYDNHLLSLEKSKITSGIIIFLVEQHGGRLCIYENIVFKRFYLLSNDKNILLYLKDVFPKVNYVIFKSADSIEIIDLSKLEELLLKAKDNEDVRGGTMINATLKTYIDL